MKKKFSTIILLILFAAIILIFLIRERNLKVSCDTYKKTDFYFDTVVEITLYDDKSLNEEAAEKILSECMSLCEKYENLFSRTKEGSDIWRINHSNGNKTTVDDETVTLIKDALYYAEISAGISDPTVGALSLLWGIGTSESNEVPSDNEIIEALNTIDYKKVIIEDKSITLLNEGAMLDLGFIAKGYAADKIKEYLISKNIKSALINLGGNVLVIGNKPDGTPFNIGIKDPINPSGAPITAYEVSDKSVVSSGNYERYFIKDGVRYHHILSVTDGFPVQSGLSQVTIIAPTSEEADALSTICFILGYEKGKAFLFKYFPEVSAIFTDESGNIIS